MHPNRIKTVQCVLYRIVFEINMIPQMSPVQIPKLQNVFLFSSRNNINNPYLVLTKFVLQELN
jgi:hypothetical protein